MKIRSKFILALSLVLIVLGCVFNLLIRETLQSNMEKGINDNLKGIMNSTQEYIKYRLITNASSLSEDGVNEEADYILKYITLNYNCNCEICTMEGKCILNSGNTGYENIINKGIEKAKKGMAVVNLKYTNKSVNGILSYPVSANEDYLGIISINKNYNELYESYLNTVGIITLIEVVVFSGIFILAFFIVSKITKPITSLTKAVKQVEDGNYNIDIKSKGDDEVAILSKEFIRMTDKIKDQIKTIKNEEEKVQKLEKSRTEFFNNVTHEIKTPLTAISGYAEMMSQGIVEDEEFRKRAIERIYSESERLLTLVLDLIDVSKGLSFVDEEWKQINMCDILNEICDDMDIKAKKYSLKIVRDIKSGSILGQTNKIKEVVINVLDNAIKYSIKDEKIIVMAGIEGRNYIFEVMNKSEPIPEDIYNSIFDPFVKSKNSSEEQSRGLGLYICNEIVKEHDGEIAVENGDNVITKIKIPCFSNNLETK